VCSSSAAAVAAAAAAAVSCLVRAARQELQRLESSVAKSERVAMNVLQDLRSMRSNSRATELRSEVSCGWQGRGGDWLGTALSAQASAGRSPTVQCKTLAGQNVLQPVRPLRSVSRATEACSEASNATVEWGQRHRRAWGGEGAWYGGVSVGPA
jgi:hypothetical protein